MNIPGRVRKSAVAALLIVGAAVLPVALYDRLVVKELLRQRSEPLALPQAVNLYHQAFYAWQESPEWSMSWVGVPIVQNPNDVWIAQQLISRLRPDFIVETGTWCGGSAVLWAMIQEQVNPQGRVITIDIKDFVERDSLPPIARKKVDFMIGSSTDPQIVAEVTRRVAGRKVMVILDADHHKPHVLAELRAYAPLVNVGSYLIVQDTNINGHPVRPDFGPGPMEAVIEFLQSDERFKADRGQERFMFTMNPRGYLVRLR